LEQEAAHSITKDVGDHSKILDEGLGALKPFHMSNELADLDRGVRFEGVGKKPGSGGDRAGVGALRSSLSPEMARGLNLARRRGAAAKERTRAPTGYG
jgi:hypothetical protein